ncbi:MAG: ATP-binding protein [Candidatus Electrothrix sp. GW3-4]|uniref:ATP-binding protein n=1 Tax=Candidatus Electrothrix sp. GW3-4 TaxID=3126740 RepID=UPI0030D5E62D
MADTAPLSPFVAGPMITTPSRFVGRREELTLLAQQMDGAHPTSVNVVGERHMGKSSLLYHFVQTWEQRVNHPSHFVVVYLDLQARTPPTEAAFLQALGRALAQQPAIQRVASLRRTLLAPPRTQQDFTSLLEQLTDHVLLPVFCLDEFEALLRNDVPLTDSFFDQLRGWMNTSQLMFILSSRRPLDVYAGEQNLTSAFFNLGHVVELGEFSKEETEELLCLPLDGKPALDPKEQQLARQWGKRHPLWLQLAALSLWEAQQGGKKSTRRAKAKFAQQHKRFVARKAQQTFSVMSAPKAVFWNFPRWVGSLPLRFGRIADDTTNFIVALGIILLGNRSDPSHFFTQQEAEEVHPAPDAEP